MQVRLILLSGSRVGDEVRVEEEAVLGRLPECQLRLDDAGVSRRHARVRVESDSVWLEDLGSSNGTKVAGRRVQEVRIDDGDVFELGQVKIRLRVVRDVATTTPEVDTSAPGFEELDLDDLGGGDSAPAPPVVHTPDPPQAAPPPVAPPVVEVRNKPAVSAPQPPDGPVVTKAASSSGYVPRVAASRRAGVLGEDLSQQSGAPKILIIGVVVVAAAAVFWLVFSSMR